MQKKLMSIMGCLLITTSVFAGRVKQPAVIGDWQVNNVYANIVAHPTQFYTKGASGQRTWKDQALADVCRKELGYRPGQADQKRERIERLAGLVKVAVGNQNNTAE